MWAALRINVILVNICGQRTGTIDRSNSGNINNVVWLYSLSEVLCSVLGELESAYEVTLVENILIDSRIIKVDNIGVKLRVVEVLDLLESWICDAVVALENQLNRSLHHSKGREPKKIELDEAHRLQVADVLTLGPRRLPNTLGVDERHVLVQVLGNHNTTSVAGRRTNLTNKRLDVCFHIWILAQEVLQRIRELKNLLPRWVIHSSLDPVLALGKRSCLLDHSVRYQVDLTKLNTIELGNILDKRLQLKGVPV